MFFVYSHKKVFVIDDLILMSALTRGRVGYIYVSRLDIFCSFHLARNIRITLSIRKVYVAKKTKYNVHIRNVHAP